MSKRLISQDGLSNIPFDIAAVVIINSTVYGYTSGNDCRVILASYSTKEKAKSALCLMTYTLAKENIFEFPQEEEIL